MLLTIELASGRNSENLLNGWKMNGQTNEQMEENTEEVRDKAVTFKVIKF